MPNTKYPITFKDVPGTFLRANSTYAQIDHADAPGGKPDSMKMSDKVSSFLQKFPPNTKVLFTFQKDEWGSKTITFIKKQDAPGGEAPVPTNEETGGQVPDTRTVTPEIPGVVEKSDWSIGGTITKKDRLIVLQTCLKVAGEVYAASPGADVNKAPQIVTEWAIYMSRGIIAEANRE